ncbi:MAG: SRPBCC family protein [Rectinemataceae bacterium]
MKGKFQWELNLEIKAPTAKVWGIADDLSLIPSYHPEVGRVDFIEGRTQRAVGVKYRCNVLEGRKGNCTEEVLEYIPGRKISTVMREDSWGMDKIFANFVVDTTVLRKDEDTTILKFEAFYNPIGFANRLLNRIVLRRVTRKRSLSVMEGIKKYAEK